MNKRFVRYAAAAVAALASGMLAAATVRAEGEKIGDTQQCVPLAFVDETPIINTSTILVKMKTPGYKRIDLKGPCSGLKFNGFSHTTHSDQLCTSDTLDVIQSGGQICMIDKIVTISETDAKALQAKKQ